MRALIFYYSLALALYRRFSCSRLLQLYWQRQTESNKLSDIIHKRALEINQIGNKHIQVLSVRRIAKKKYAHTNYNIILVTFFLF